MISIITCINIFVLQLVCFATDTVVFTKYSYEGVKIIVYMEESYERRVGTNVVNHENSDVNVGEMYDVMRYTGYVETGKTNRLFWKKTIAKMQIPQIPHEWNHLRIFDVEIKQDVAVILYSDEDVFLDLTNVGDASVQKDKIMVFDQAGTIMMTSRRIVWLDHLYIVGEIQSNSRSPIFIRVDSSKATRLYPSALDKP